MTFDRKMVENRKKNKSMNFFMFWVLWWLNCQVKDAWRRRRKTRVNANIKTKLPNGGCEMRQEDMGARGIQSTHLWSVNWCSRQLLPHPISPMIMYLKIYSCAMSEVNMKAALPCWHPQGILVSSSRGCCSKRITRSHKMQDRIIPLLWMHAHSIEGNRGEIKKSKNPAEIQGWRMGVGDEVSQKRNPRQGIANKPTSLPSQCPPHTPKIN